MCITLICTATEVKIWSSSSKKPAVHVLEIMPGDIFRLMLHLFICSCWLKWLLQVQLVQFELYIHIPSRLIHVAAMITSNPFTVKERILFSYVYLRKLLLRLSCMQCNVLGLLFIDWCLFVWLFAHKSENHLLISYLDLLQHFLVFKI